MTDYMKKIIQRQEAEAKHDVMRCEGLYISELRIKGHKTDYKGVQHDFNETLPNLMLQLELGNVRICKGCRGCANFREKEDDEYIGYCNLSDIPVTDDDYCSFREEEKNG